MAQGIDPPNGGKQQRGAATLLRRFFAFLLDMAVLGVPALAVGTLFFDAASDLGDWGRLVGLALALLYFGLFDSGRGRGQSPGKRALHVKVIREDGMPLSPAMAGLRALILSAPFYLNGISREVEPSPVVSALLTFLVFGLSLSIIYLFIFNRSRRSLHDLVTGAVVVDTRAAELPLPRPVWRGHWIVVGAICAVTLGLPLVAGTASDSGMAGFRAIRDTVVAHPAVKTARIGFHKVSYTTLKSGSGQSEFFQIAVNLRTAPTEARARELEDAIFAAHAEKIGPRRLAIVLQRGFTFGGLASARTRFTLSTSLSDWEARTRARARNEDSRPPVMRRNHFPDGALASDDIHKRRSGYEWSDQSRRRGRVRADPDGFSGISRDRLQRRGRLLASQGAV